MTWARGSRARRVRTSGARSSAEPAPTPPGTGKARSPERRGRGPHRATLLSSPRRRAARGEGSECNVSAARAHDRSPGAGGREQEASESPLAGAHLNLMGPRRGAAALPVCVSGPRRGVGGGFPRVGPRASQLSAGVRQLPDIPYRTLPEAHPGPAGRGKPLPQLCSQPESQIVLLAEFPSGSPFGRSKKKKEKKSISTQSKMRIEGGECEAGCRRRAVDAGSLLHPSTWQ